jgi:copper(I)-binding protein
MYMIASLMHRLTCRGTSPVLSRMSLHTSRRTSRRVLTALLATALLSAGAAQAADAAPTISHCWIRALPGNIPSGGYLILANPAHQPVDLVDVQSPAFGMVMLHRSLTEGGTSRMVMVDKLTVPAHGTVAFTPGDYHLMLEQPKRAPQIGSQIALTFGFNSGQTVRAMCLVKNAGASGE